MEKNKCVVFLHGFLESREMWKDFEAYFSRDYHTLSIDLPGHGISPVLGEIHSMEIMADFVKSELDSRNIEKAVFIGHSMGGYVALELGKKFPQKVAGVSLFHSTAAPDAEQKKKERLRAIEVVKKNHKIFIREAIPFLYTEEHKVKYQKEINSQIEVALNTSVEGITASLAGMRIRASNIAFLNEAPFPIQIIVGKKDPVITMESLDEQLNSKQVVDVEIIDDCGHVGHIEAKEQTLSAVRRFLEKV